MLLESIANIGLWLFVGVLYIVTAVSVIILGMLLLCYIIDYTYNKNFTKILLNWIIEVYNESFPTSTTSLRYELRNEISKIKDFFNIINGIIIYLIVVLLAIAYFSSIIVKITSIGLAILIVTFAFLTAILLILELVGFETLTPEMYSKLSEMNNSIYYKLGGIVLIISLLFNPALLISTIAYSALIFVSLMIVVMIIILIALNSSSNKENITYFDISSF